MIWKATLELKGLSRRILYEPSKCRKLINIESPSRYRAGDISFYWPRHQNKQLDQNYTLKRAAIAGNLPPFFLDLVWSWFLDETERTGP